MAVIPVRFFDEIELEAPRGSESGDVGAHCAPGFRRGLLVVPRHEALLILASSTRVAGVLFNLIGRQAAAGIYILFSDASRRLRAISRTGRRVDFWVYFPTMSDASLVSHASTAHVRFSVVLTGENVILVQTHRCFY